MSKMSPSRLLFRSFLANKEPIFAKFENDSKSKKFYFKTLFNYSLIVVTFVRYVLYGWFPNAVNQTEIVSRQLLGDCTYNWGQPLRKYLWFILCDCFLAAVVFGFLFLFGKNRNNWLEIIDVLVGESQRTKSQNTKSQKTRNQLLKSAILIFRLTESALRLAFVGAIVHFFVLPLFGIFEYQLPNLVVFVKRIPLLLLLMPFQLLDAFVIFEFFTSYPRLFVTFT